MSQGEGTEVSGGGAHIREATVTLLPRLHQRVPAHGGHGRQAVQPLEEAAAQPPQEGPLQGPTAAVAEVEAWQEAGMVTREVGAAASPPPPAPPPPACSHSLRGGLHDAALGRGWARAGAAAPRQVVGQAQAVAQLVSYGGRDSQDAAGVVLAVGRGQPRSSTSPPPLLSRPPLTSRALGLPPPLPLKQEESPGLGGGEAGAALSPVAAPRCVAPGTHASAPPPPLQGAPAHHVKTGKRKHWPRVTVPGRQRPCHTAPPRPPGPRAHGFGVGMSVKKGAGRDPRQLTMFTPPERSGEQMEFWTAVPTAGPEKDVALRGCRARVRPAPGARGQGAGVRRGLGRGSYVTSWALSWASRGSRSWRRQRRKLCNVRPGSWLISTRSRWLQASRPTSATRTFRGRKN